MDGKPVAGSRSEIAFQLIKRMFGLEHSWKDKTPEERLKLRRQQLKPVLDQYWEYLASFGDRRKGQPFTKPRVYPKSELICAKWRK